MKTTKANLVESLAAKCGVSKVKALEMLDNVFGVVQSALKSPGDSVALVGFGTFAVKTRAARKGTNPATGKPIDIAAASKLGFKASKSFVEGLSS